MSLDQHVDESVLRTPVQDDCAMTVIVSRARSVPQGSGQGLGQFPLLGESFCFLHLLGLFLLLRQL